MPRIKICIIKGIPIGAPVDVENVLHRDFFSVADLIQNQLLIAQVLIFSR
jgi:hypothetical protein